MPAILACGWAAIAHLHAAAWLRSIETLDSVRHDIERALAQDPAPAAILMLDVPELVRGVAPLDRAAKGTFLAAPQFVARDATELVRLRERCAGVVLLAAPTDQAFAQFSRSERFSELRVRGIAVAVDGPKSRERLVLRLPPASETKDPRRWYREGDSSPIDWESLTLRCVTARGPRDTDTSQAPILGWSASGEGADFQSGEIRGAWIDRDGEPHAYFDVGSSVEWLCAGRVRQAWPVNGWSNLSEADAQDELPDFEKLEPPTPEGDDWHFPSLLSPIVDAATTTLARRGMQGEWTLAFCDLETLEQARFELEARSSAAPRDRIARGAGRIASAWSARGHTFAWSLEFSAGGVALVRRDGLVRPEGLVK